MKKDKKAKKKHAQGRNPLPDMDRKERIVVYIEKRKIDARGGEKAMQQHLYQMA